MAALVNVFGCAFDPEVGGERLAMKRAYAALGLAGLPPGAPADPAAVLKPYALELAGVGDGGTIEVEGWARPVPAVADPHALTAEASLAQMRAGACRVVAERVREHRPGAGVPLMLGIDHSASGGAIEAASARHGAENLTVVVLDAHLDAVPGDIRQGLLAYAGEHPEIFGVLATQHAAANEAPDYDCGSFLHALIARGIVLPHRLVVLGCADLPPPGLRAVTDARVQRYLAHYDALVARGLRAVPREAILAAPDIGALVRATLAGERGKAAYVSVDMDVGAHAALTGVRFLDQEGLPAEALFALFEAVLAAVTSERNHLAGLDLMEFDFYRAGAETAHGRDATYDIALRIIETVAARLAHTTGRTQWESSLASA